VGVVARSGVDDGGQFHPGQAAGGVVFAVADDDPVGAHGAEVGEGIFEGFAFFGGAFGRIEMDHLGPQAFGGDLEGAAGAGGVFEKEGYQQSAFQQRWRQVLFESSGGAEDLADLIQAQVVGVNQMLHHGLLFCLAL